MQKRARNSFFYALGGGAASAVRGTQFVVANSGTFVATAAVSLADGYTDRMAATAAKSVTPVQGTVEAVAA